MLLTAEPSNNLSAEERKELVQRFVALYLNSEERSARQQIAMLVRNGTLSESEGGDILFETLILATPRLKFSPIFDAAIK